MATSKESSVSGIGAVAEEEDDDDDKEEEEAEEEEEKLPSPTHAGRCFLEVVCLGAAEELEEEEVVLFFWT